MNTPLTDQLRAYFDDVDRQQGAVDLDALVHSGEERLVTIELLPEDAGAPTGGRRWPTLLAAAAAVVATAGAFVVLPGDDATRTDQQSPTVTVPPTVPAPAWSPELSARVVTPPIPCRPWRSEWMCPSLAVAPDGTLVAYDPLAATLTWYEDEPRVVVVSPAAELTLDALMVIGPHDIAYFHAGGHVVAVDPSGTEITRMIGSNNGRHATATGLAEFGSGCLTVDAAEAMPWVDLEGNPIIDTAPYPSATFADSGIEVRLGERGWLLPYQEVGGRMNCLDFLPRSDGGVVVVLDTVEPGYYDRIRLLELLPDGTVDRYFVRGDLQPVVLPDGSWIVQDDGQFVHLTPPT